MERIQGRISTITKLTTLLSIGLIGVKDALAEGQLSDWLPQKDKEAEEDKGLVCFPENAVIINKALLIKKQFSGELDGNTVQLAIKDMPFKEVSDNIIIVEVPEYSESITVDFLLQDGQSLESIYLLDELEVQEILLDDTDPLLSAITACELTKVDTSSFSDDDFFLPLFGGIGGAGAAVIGGGDEDVVVENRAPVLNDVSSLPSSDADDANEFSLNLGQYFSDPDGDSLTYSLAGADWLTVDPVSGVVSGQPSGSHSGLNTFTLTISDENGHSIEEVFTVNVNTTPDFVEGVYEIPTATVQEGNAYSNDLSSYFQDAENDSITYSITGPDWLVIDQATGIVSGSPATDDVGSHSYTLSVTDDYGLTRTETFIIDVLPIATQLVEMQTLEDTPLGMGDMSGGASTSSSLMSAMAEVMAEGDVIDYASVQVANGTVSFDADNNATFTPDENFFGKAYVEYTKTTAEGLVVNSVVAIDVIPVNDLAEGTVKIKFKRGEKITVTDDPEIEVEFEVDGKSTKGNDFTPPDDKPTIITIGYKDPEGKPARFKWIEDPTETTVEINEDTVGKNIDVMGANKDSGLTIKSITSTNGSASVNSDGTVNVTPEANFHGSIKINFVVTDGNYDFNVTKEIQVNPVNDEVSGTPTISGLYAEGNVLEANTSGLFDVEGKPDETDMLIQWFGGADGTTLLGEGKNYTVQGSDYGHDIFIKVSFTDGEGYSESVSSELVPYALPPEAVNDTYQIDENSGTHLFDVLANDKDDFGIENLRITEASSAQGTVEIVDGKISFTPIAHFNGTATISYTIKDDTGQASTGTATITVNPVNSTPTGSVVITGIPTEGETLTASNTISDPDGLGEITYEWFSDGVSVGTGATYQVQSSDAQKTLTVKASYTDGFGTVETLESSVDHNYTPTAVNDEASTDEDVAILINVLENDVDLDGDELSISDVSAENGTIEIIGSQIRYIPNKDYFGSDTITYSISDGFTRKQTASVDVEISPQNDAASGTVSIDGTFEYGQTLTAVNDITDIDGLVSVTYKWFGGADGTTLLQEGSEKTYVLTGDDRDTFIHVEAVSLDALGNEQTFSSTESYVPTFNMPPVGSTVNVDLFEDSYQFLFIKNHASDENNNDVLTTTGFTEPQHGRIVESANGRYDYYPDANWYGTDQVVYTVADQDGLTTEVIVNYNVTPVEDSTSGAVSWTGDVEDGGVLTASHTLVDADGVNNVAYEWRDGNNAVLGSGETFTLDEALHEGITLKLFATFTQDDGATRSVSTSSVIQINNTPVANEDNGLSVDEDTSITVNVLENDTDADGDALSVTNAVITGGSGTVIVNDDNTLTFTPAANFFGNVVIRYTLSDGKYQGDTTGYVRLTVNPVNDAPVANDDTASVYNNTLLSNIRLISNDTDIENDTLTIISATSEHGEVTIKENGYIDFMPARGFGGDAVINYTISDGNGGTSSAKAIVTVDTPFYSEYVMFEAHNTDWGNFGDGQMVELADGTIVSAFHASGIEDDENGIRRGYEILFQTFNSDMKATSDLEMTGTNLEVDLLGNGTLYDQGSQVYPEMVKLADGGFLLVYVDGTQDQWVNGATVGGNGVYARKFDKFGTPVGDEIHINTGDIESHQYQISVIEHSDGSYGIAYWSSATMSFSIREYNADGSYEKAVELDATNYVFSDDNRIIGSEDGGYILGNNEYWANYRDGSRTKTGRQPKFTKFDADGAQVAQYKWIPSGAADEETISQEFFVLNDGNIGVISAHQGPSTYFNRLKYSVLDQDLNPISLNIPLEISTYRSSYFSGDDKFSVAVLSNGNFVVAFAYDDPGTTGYESRIKYEIYQPDGTRVADSEGVYSHYAADQVYESQYDTEQDPNVIATSDGGFVISWTGYDYSAKTYRQVMNKFDDAGQPMGMGAANAPALASDMTLTMDQDTTLSNIDVTGAASPVVGDTLVAENAFTDIEGVTNNLTYTWYNENDEVIGTGSEYVVQSSDSGLGIYIVADFVDGQGSNEQVQSQTTMPVVDTANVYADQIIVVEDSIVSPNGSVSINDDGTLNFTPNSGFIGNTHIDLKVTNGFRETDVRITVNVENTGPQFAPMDVQEDPTLFENELMHTQDVIFEPMIQITPEI